ncbi:MAG TPA: cytochrome c oxidase subunit II [Streptosporangiaceae bacterium]|nr:cytochrome c oxidase subunit II [Streptosporangiaceae bacterium]
MATTTPAAPDSTEDPAGAGEPRHGLRIFLLWVVPAIAADLLLWFVYGPHMPPGGMSSSAASQQFDFKVMAVLATPVVLFVLIFSGYAFVTWRARKDDDSEHDGAPIRGHVRVQVAWITISSVLVLGLAGFGTYELIAPNGAGSGEGPSPVWNPTGARLTVAQMTAPWRPGHELVVQVIAQQWLFTFRYPQFGGVETPKLELPVDTPIQFDVTSLDVIHSFWAYQLGVKADANPQVDNVAYTTTRQTGTVNVRCAELCGLWHGAMYTDGKVVPAAAFEAWARSTQAQLASVTKTLPRFALIYTPNEIKGLNKLYYQAGLPGAGGGYYPAQYYPYEP